MSLEEINKPVNNQEYLLNNLNDFNQLRYGYPDENGHYGVFGGTFVAETLIQPLTDLKNTYYNNSCIIYPCATLFNL